MNLHNQYKKLKEQVDSIGGLVPVSSDKLSKDERQNILTFIKWVKIATEGFRETVINAEEVKK